MYNWYMGDYEVKEMRKNMIVNQEIRTVDRKAKIYTTILLKRTTRDRLKLLKLHPRQSFDEVINEILDYIESSECESGFWEKLSRRLG